MYSSLLVAVPFRTQRSANALIMRTRCCARGHGRKAGLRGAVHNAQSSHCHRPLQTGDCQICRGIVPGDNIHSVTQNGQFSQAPRGLLPYAPVPARFDHFKLACFIYCQRQSDSRVYEVVQHAHKLNCVENEVARHKLRLPVDDTGDAGEAKDVGSDGEEEQVVQRRRQCGLQQLVRPFEEKVREPCMRVIMLQCNLHSQLQSKLRVTQLCPMALL